MPIMPVAIDKDAYEQRSQQTCGGPITIEPVAWYYTQKPSKVEQQEDDDHIEHHKDG